jgi:pimeloyl-ACP methyl ester carboxylesterase
MLRDIIDLPGFGALRHLRRSFTLATAAQWLTSSVNALGLETFAVIGHSMGGMIALGLMTRWPDRVRRAVLAYDSLRAGPLTLWRVGREPLASDAADRPGEIRMPTLVIHGECDRLHVIRSAGHVPMFDRPHEFNTVPLRFLAGEDVGS